MTESTTTPDPKPAPPDPSTFFAPGSIAERVELQLGVLTQGVVDCMILATGAFPNLTEGEPTEPNAFGKHPKLGTPSTWQAARSAELRDAARLTEASARLLTGFAKYRGQFAQDFTIRHNERRKDDKDRLRNTTITRRFSVPEREVVTDAAPPADAAPPPPPDM